MEFQILCITYLALNFQDYLLVTLHFGNFFLKKSLSIVPYLMVVGCKYLLKWAHEWQQRKLQGLTRSRHHLLNCTPKGPAWPVVYCYIYPFLCAGVQEGVSRPLLLPVYKINNLSYSRDLLYRLSVVLKTSGLLKSADKSIC